MHSVTGRPTFVLEMNRTLKIRSRWNIICWKFLTWVDSRGYTKLGKRIKLQKGKWVLRRTSLEWLRIKSSYHSLRQEKKDISDVFPVKKTLSCSKLQLLNLGTYLKTVFSGSTTTLTRIKRRTEIFSLMLGKREPVLTATGVYRSLLLHKFSGKSKLRECTKKRKKWIFLNSDVEKNTKLKTMFTNFINEENLNVLSGNKQSQMGKGRKWSRVKGRKFCWKR